MGSPIDPKLTLVQVAADYDGEPGDFATIADATGYDADHGADDPTETRVFGEEEPHTRAGELTDDYSIDGLYNVADTDGQNVLKNSRDLGIPCWIQVLHDGASGYRQKVRVTGYTDSATADGEWVEVSFAARGVAGTMEPVEAS